MNTHDFDVAAIALKFQVTGSIAEVRNYGTGHINDTFLLKNSSPAQPDYLLQRINHHVFKDVTGLMENIARVTDHLESKLIPDSNQKLLRLIDTKDGNTFYKDIDGNY